MYLHRCGWWISNQLPQLASPAAGKTGAWVSMGQSHLHHSTGICCISHTALARQVHFHCLISDIFFCHCEQMREEFILVSLRPATVLHTPGGYMQYQVGFKDNNSRCDLQQLTFPQEVFRQTQRLVLCHAPGRWEYGRKGLSGGLREEIRLQLTV